MGETEVFFFVQLVIQLVVTWTAIKVRLSVYEVLLVCVLPPVLWARGVKAVLITWTKSPLLSWFIACFSAYLMFALLSALIGMHARGNTPVLAYLEPAILWWFVPVGKAIYHTVERTVVCRNRY